MTSQCRSSHIEEIMDLLEKMSSYLSDIGEQLELLNELRDDIEGELDDYADEVNTLETVLSQCEDELREIKRPAVSEAEKKAVLQKLFFFDSVVPMTNSERVSVYNRILSDEYDHGDVCLEADNYLNELRKTDLPFVEEKNSFENVYSESLAKLL